ncbi:hypothetical protein KY290_005014 [Solanum tuberosum]|uniref:Uncharacterized protein n=1 Tax=Solanum tuberosum TaxID=4113 RepID=A0ABQ7WCV9_SOLTU|nr:hypothetical protein KY289_005378 [Solanum tuberosum]KAH0778587.1 hypothetical protein KY290_005014 [Solanum tuberosum]
MSNTSSSSKSHLSQCGLGETGESPTPHTEALESPLPNPRGKPSLFSNDDPVSSTMSDRIFDGDLPKGKETEPNILLAAEELVVQSLASLRRVIQSPFLEGECRSLEQVPQWVQPVFDKTPKPVGVTSEADDEEELILHLRLEVLMNLLNLTRKERKGKGKVVESKMRGETESSSDIECEDINRALAKRQKEGPSPTAQRPYEEKVLTREEYIAELKRQKVLNGRVFDSEILTKPGLCTRYDFISLQSWEHLFECLVSYLHELEVHEFYYKMELLDDSGIQTTVREVKKV